MQGTTITSKATKQQLEGGGKDIPEKNKQQGVMAWQQGANNKSSVSKVAQERL